jgi:hypothetical protein
MTYECIYNPKLNTIEAATHGMADMTALLEMLHRIAELCRQEQNAKILIDHSDLDASLLTMKNIESISLSTVSFKDIFMKRKCAHVVAKDLQFGLVRAWEIIIAMNDFTEIETKLFRNIDDAVVWLNAG